MADRARVLRSLLEDDMGNVVSVTGNGTATNGHAALKIKSYAPATGELLGEVPNTSAEEVRAVVARAHRAQEAWGALPIANRSDIGWMPCSTGKQAARRLPLKALLLPWSSRLTSWIS